MSHPVDRRIPAILVCLLGCCGLCSGMPAAQPAPDGPWECEPENIYSLRLVPKLISNFWLEFADVDGRGSEDLITSSWYQKSIITIYPGEGGFDFSNGIEIAPAMEGPVVTRPYDVDDDGDLDLVVVHSLGLDEPGYVSIMKNDGSGNFKIGQIFEAGIAPTPLLIGDLNGDSAADLVVGNFGPYEASTITVAFGNGDGTFEMPEQYAVGTSTWGIALVDVDHDGDLDVVAADKFGGNYTILFNAGDGSFQEKEIVETSAAPRNVIARDLDEDGLLDLILSGLGSTGGQVGVAYGMPEGGFETPTWYTAGHTLGRPAVVDFDLDGHLDIVVPDLYGSDDVFILRNDGNRNFAPEPPIFAGIGQYMIRFHDVDGDSHRDLIGSGPLISEFVETNDALPQRYQIGPRAVPTLLADLDTDGADELILHEDDKHVRIYNYIDRELSLIQEIQVEGTGAGLASGDLDGDGSIDVIANIQGPEAAVFLNDGTGALQPSHDVELSLATNLHNIRIADMNGDNLGDILFLAGGSNDFVGTLLQTDDGTFVAPPVVFTHRDISDFALGDINADGNIDAIAVAPSQDKAFLLLNNGDGVLEDGGTWTLPDNPRGPNLVDITGDGLLDFVIAHGSDPRTIAIYPGTGEGIFESPVEIESEYWPVETHVGYLNEDSELDLIIRNSATDELSLLISNGKDAYAHHLVPYGDMQTLLIGDIDGNGSDDLVQVHDGASGSLVIMLNRCDGRCLFDLAGGDQTVDQDDLLMLLSTWGDCPPDGGCIADLDGSLTVDVADLLLLLANWGPCE